MSQIEFYDENQNIRSAVWNPTQQTEQASGIAKFFIDKGIAKNKQQAQMIMAIITLLCFGLTLWIIFG